MQNRSSLGILFLLAIAFSSTAHARGRGDDRDIYRDVFRFGPRVAAIKPPKVALQCGDTVTSSVTLAADLSCPLTTGFALNVVGANITVDGGGHKIIAPLASAGLFVQGANITVRNFKINGVLNGDGILAYETPNARLVGNDVSGNSQGIVVYADTGVVNGMEISRNVARGNALFGVRTGYDAPGAIVSPSIHDNDLSNSGSYGLLVKATKFELGGDHGNVLKNSMNGIYVAGGDVSLHDFSLLQDRLSKVGIFADSLGLLAVNNLDVSTLAPASPAQERVGLDLYRVARFTINELVSAGNDVGIKFETELGVVGSGSIRNSRFLNNLFGGIYVVSYDGTAYGQLRFTQNCFRLNAPAARVVVGAAVGGSSTLDDGLNACDGCDHGHDDDDDDRGRRGR